MKKSGKIMLGLLTIGALVGTAYASWTVNNYYNKVETEPEESTVVENLVGNDIAKLNISRLNSGIKFDGDINGSPNLTASYNVKAEGKSGKNPYLNDNPHKYDDYTYDYQPNLKVSVKALRAGKEITKEGETADDFFKYVSLPESQVISYSAWLSADAFTEGYTFNLDFKWALDPDHKNPDQVWKDLEPAAKETKFTEMITALKDVKFVYTFQIGEPTASQYSSASVGSGISNGEVTLSSTEKHVVGTKITVNAVPSVGYKLDSIYVDGEAISGNTFALKETGNVVTAKFSKITVKVTKTVTPDLTGKISGTTPDTVEYGTKYTFDVTPEPGYKLVSVKYNTTEDATLVEGTKYSIDILDKDVDIVATFEALPTVEVATINATFDASKGTVTIPEGLEVGGEATVTITPLDGNEITSITFNDAPVTVNGTSYTLTGLKKENTLNVVFNAVETVTKITTTEALNKNVGDSVTVDGKAVKTFEDGSFMLHDGTQYIRVIPAAKAVLTENNNYTVTGKISQNLHKDKVGEIISPKHIENAVLEDLVTDKFDSVKLTDTEATLLEPSFLEKTNWKNIVETQKYVKFRGQVVVSGTYKNLNIEGSDRVISIIGSDTILDTFEDKQVYDFRAFLGGLSGYYDTARLNVYLDYVSEPITINPTSITYNGGNEVNINSDLEMNKITLNGPWGINVEPVFSVKNGTGAATIDASTGVLSATKQGKVTVTISCGTAEPLNIEVTILPEGSAQVQPASELFVFNDQAFIDTYPKATTVKNVAGDFYTLTFDQNGGGTPPRSWLNSKVPELRLYNKNLIVINKNSTEVTDIISLKFSGANKVTVTSLTLSDGTVVNDTATSAYIKSTTEDAITFNESVSSVTLTCNDGVKLPNFEVFKVTTSE